MKHTITALFMLLMAGKQAGFSQGEVKNFFSDDKIYIHYDKPYYVAGETIWFKAYLFSNGKPDGNSNNFYLQLFDTRGRHIATKKYPVKGATVRGDIELPDSLPQGYYSIRAVTPAMLNNAPFRPFYQKEVFVFNPSAVASLNNSPAKRPPLTIRFFPESGYLADGILMNVGFQCTDSLGRPADVSGVIKTNDTVLVASFKTLHDGMGRVQFKPYASRKYVAVVMVNGQQQYFPLPEVRPSGVNLKIDDEKGGKVFVISRTIKDKQEYGQVKLIAETPDGIVYENDIQFDNFLSVKGHIITDSLPSGTLRFTVLNKEGVPLAERISFVNNNEYRAVADAQTEKKGIEAKGENVINIVFPEIIQRSCSVSVTALTDNQASPSDNIISALLLSPAVKGYIHDPAWYFNDTTAATRPGLDNLMLIQGWSQIKVTKETNTTARPPVEDNYLLHITGYLKDAKTKTPVTGGKLGVFFETADSVNHSYEVDVDAAGRFAIDSLLFRGETKFYYGYTNAKGKESPADIFLEAIPADTTVEKLVFNSPGDDCCPPFPADITDAVMRIRYSSGNSKLEETKTLAPVEVKSSNQKRPIDMVNEKYTKGVFTAMGKVNFDNINEPENNRALSVFDFIKRSIAQVAVEDENFVNRKNFSISAPMTQKQEKEKQEKITAMENSPYGGGAEMERLRNENAPGKKYIVAIFLNESPVFANSLKTITMDDVAMIKFYDAGFVGAGGTDGPGGAIAVYTKNKTPVAPAGMEKLDHIMYKGYAVEKEFYSPDYSIPSSDRSAPDNRTTIYWNPELYTSENSPGIRLRFFNSDISHRLKIVLEGFDVNGKLVHLEKIIE